LNPKLADEAAAVRHYNRAPIVEAILEFLIPELPAEKQALLDDVIEALSATYPEPFRRSPEDAGDDRSGKSRRSADGLQVVHVRTNGLGFSRLAPYEDWERFTAEARRVWNIYSGCTEPAELSGFAARYINSLRVPLRVPLYKFFNIYPVVPERDTLFHAMFMFLEMPVQKPPGSHSVFMAPQQLTAAEGATHFQMILDNSFNFEVKDPDSIWRSLADIRKLKNDTFNSQITDELKETIA
jgi:uncharacterized protein (TIGR04255 family)